MTNRRTLQELTDQRGIIGFLEAKLARMTEMYEEK
jgi:hypothetical protein